jgi:ATP-dependent exoDNAse (exonuclease V) alpha subunit
LDSFVPITSHWDDKFGQSQSQTQLPIALAWAITIHKSQGLTLSDVVIDLGEKEFSAGLSFVAISRVKTLKGLAFWTHFPWSHIQQPEETPTAKALREDMNAIVT